MATFPLSVRRLLEIDLPNLLDLAEQVEKITPELFEAYATDRLLDHPDVQPRE